MENKDENGLFEDMCNIARVLPNLAASTIYSDLKNMKDNPNRVKLILRKYFASYEAHEHNCMSDDIKKIKRVLPEYPFIHINNDLLAVEDKENRIQLVLKRYFDNQVKAAKRSLLLDNIDSTNSSPDKRFKSNEETTDSPSIINSEQITNSEEKEHSSNETETESYTVVSEEFEPANFHFDKEEICNTVSDKTKEEHLIEIDANDQNSNVSKETNDDQCEENIKKSMLLENITSLNANDQNINDSEETEEYECEKPFEKSSISIEQRENNETEKTSLLSILSNLFPQHSLAVFNFFCQDFGIDIYATPNESSIDLVVNSLINYCSPEEYHLDELKITKVYSVPDDDQQSSVSGCAQSKPAEGTAQFDVDDLQIFFRDTIENIVLNIGDKEQSSKSDKEESNITVPTSPINKEPVQTDYSTPQTVEEPTACTSLFVNNPVPSTSTTISTTALMQSPSAFLHDIIKTYESESTDTDVSEAKRKSNSLNFENALLNNVLPELHPLLDMENRSANRTTKPTVLASRPNTIIKPASFHPKTSTVTSAHSTGGNLSRNFRSIIKPSSFLPRTNRTTPSNQNVLAAGLKNENFTHHLPSTSGSTCSFATRKQDINKNTIRVRTDLYDTYFNGPVLQSSNLSIPTLKTKHLKKKDENDDIIFISVDHLPPKTTTVLNPIIINDQNLTNLPTNDTSASEPTSTAAKVPKIEDKPIYTNNDMKPSTSKASETHPYYFKLLEIFPDICPDYLRSLCSKNTENQTVDDLISILLNGDYKRRDRAVSPETHLDFEEQHKILQDLFPDADPTYLQHHCERLIDQPEKFKQFVASLLENKNFPTKVEYLKKMKLSAQEKQYTTEFDVKKFLEVIPNPEEFFNDPKRQVSFENFDDTNYAVTFLKNTFCTTAIKDITSIFKKNDYSILRAALVLEKIQNMKTKRKPYPVTSCKNIPLLQEIAYVKHKKQILNYMKEQELEKKLAREQAKTAGLMKTCQCCYDDEVMPDDTATCEAGTHIFCKECIRKGCEVLIGDGKLDFPCLEMCESYFTVQVLQTVLTPKVFSKMAQRKQMAEVKSAGIEDLEFCPFCDFATIPAPGDKVFRCLNSDCMKESCRLCKEPSHIPLRCDEVEKDKDVKMRTYIEDKMTEALLRKCWKCGMKFIKESGCNKMTCSCGALMCYICNQPVQDYKHFNGQGGDQTHLCPLYSDTHKLHIDAVKRGAESAKKELGVDKENQLKIDPTVDLEQHYRRLAAQNPAIQNIPVMMPQNILPR